MIGIRSDKNLFLQGRSIGKLGLIVNYDHWHDAGSNLNKSKKMRVVSLWNDLPWFHYIFQIQWRIISTGAWVVKDPQVEWLMRYGLLKYNHRAICYPVFRGLQYCNTSISEPLRHRKRSQVPGSTFRPALARLPWQILQFLY